MRSTGREPDRHPGCSCQEQTPNKPYGMKLPYQVSRPAPPGGLAEIMITAPISPGKRRKKSGPLGPSGQGIGNVRGRCVYPQRPPEPGGPHWKRHLRARARQEAWPARPARAGDWRSARKVRVPATPAGARRATLGIGKVRGRCVYPQRPPEPGGPHWDKADANGCQRLAT